MAQPRKSASGKRKEREDEPAPGAQETAPIPPAPAVAENMDAQTATEEPPRARVRNDPGSSARNEHQQASITNEPLIEAPVTILTPAAIPPTVSTPVEAPNTVFATWIEQVESSLGYTFRDKKWLMRAMTHSSYLNESGANARVLGDNERLEFLGDAVLGLVVGEHLFQLHGLSPAGNEGMLTQHRAHLVDANACAVYFDSLGISSFLRRGRSQAVPASSLRASALEALLGAIYVDSEYEITPVRRLIVTQLIPQIGDVVGIRSTQPPMDPISWMNEYSQAFSGHPAEYLEQPREGPDHNPTFTFYIIVGGMFYGPGSGSNKREAKRRAAEVAKEALLLS